MTELPMHRIHERDEDLSDELPEGFTEAMAADLELVISALNGHLSPERVAEVTRRLEEDPAFRELAAPMLLTWSVPSYLERHPRPVGELENAWNDFAQKAGIAPAAPVAAHRRPSKLDPFRPTQAPPLAITRGCRIRDRLQLPACHAMCNARGVDHQRWRWLGEQRTITFHHPMEA